MYIAKLVKQINSDSETDFRTSIDNENKSVITRALQMRHFSLCEKIVSVLNQNGLCIPNYRALQIETAIANSVSGTLRTSPSGIDLFLSSRKENVYTIILIILTFKSIQMMVRTSFMVV